MAIFILKNVIISTKLRYFCIVKLQKNDKLMKTLSFMQCLRRMMFSGLLLVCALAANARTTSSEAKKDTTIYDKVEKLAEFRGGQQACYEFLSKNIQYPILCQLFKYGGRVMVQFVVERNGRISHVHALRQFGGKAYPEDRIVTNEEAMQYKTAFPQRSAEVYEGMNLADKLVEEAIRVVKKMPNWKPALDADGNKVRSRMTLPVLFKAQQ